MRALLIPQVVGAEVNAESDIYSHLCIMRALNEIEPSFFYVWLRRGDSCKGAVGPECRCSCLGANHGVQLLRKEKAS